MDVFSQIADERRGLADLLSGLTPEQQAAQSLCDEWSVHDVAAHVIMPLEVGLAKFTLAMLACRGNFDRANVRLTREQARRPFDEIVEVLWLKAASRFTPPGAGPDAPSPTCWCMAWTSAGHSVWHGTSQKSACRRR